MSVKIVNIDGIGAVSIYKHKRSKSLRVSIQPNGKVRVTIPYWAPYQAGVAFVRSRKDWIEQNRKPTLLTVNGSRVGKSHRLVYVPRTDKKSVRTTINGNEIVITYPVNTDLGSPDFRTKIQKACEKALKLQAEALLPGRLSSLADKHGFQFHGVNFRHLKTRWGSCSTQGEITLNIYLLTLPWELIDYVLLHELVHTEFQNHGADFWDKMLQCDSNSKANRKQLKSYNPSL